MTDWSEDLLAAKTALAAAERAMSLSKDAPTLADAINALLRCERLYLASRGKAGKT